MGAYLSEKNQCLFTACAYCFLLAGFKLLLTSYTTSLDHSAEEVDIKMTEAGITL